MDQSGVEVQLQSAAVNRDTLLSHPVVCVCVLLPVALVVPSLRGIGTNPTSETVGVSLCPSILSLSSLFLCSGKFFQFYMFFFIEVISVINCVHVCSL